MHQAVSYDESPVVLAGGLDQKGSSSARWLVMPSVGVLVLWMAIPLAMTI
jgi:sorbitol/mannitol transport system permease protein